MFKVIKGVFDFFFDDKPYISRDKVLKQAKYYEEYRDNSLWDIYIKGNPIEQEAAKFLLKSRGHDISD